MFWVLSPDSITTKASRSTIVLFFLTVIVRVIYPFSPLAEDTEHQVLASSLTVAFHDDLAVKIIISFPPAEIILGVKFVNGLKTSSFPAIGNSVSGSSPHDIKNNTKSGSKSNFFINLRFWLPRVPK